MRNSLRAMVDSGVLDAQPKSKAKKPGAAGKKNGTGSPMAKHVSEHLQDPLGSTKEGFGELSEAKMKYDLARENAKRNLLPVASVIQHVNQMHQLTDPMSGDPTGMGANPDPAMGYDEQGQPLNMTQQPGMVQGKQPMMPGQRPPGAGVGNGPMGQTPGNVAQGAQRQAVPQKMGVPQPGAPGQPGSPKPGGAAKKKPGGAAAKGGKGHSVSVEVSSASDYGIKTPGRRQIAAGAAMANLRF